MTRNNDSWVYIDGELYHSGKKGMRWGFHLPGTDWWKVSAGSRRRSNTVNVKNSSPYVSSEYQREVEFNSQQNKYPKPMIDEINDQKRNPSGPSKKESGFMDKANNKVRRIATKARTYRDRAIMKGYQVKRVVTGKINNATYKAKKIVSKYANRTLSSISSAASKYKSKVTDFLRNVVGIFNKPKQENNTSVTRRRPNSKADEAARKADPVSTSSRSNSSTRVNPYSRRTGSGPSSFNRNQTYLKK